MALASASVARAVQIPIPAASQETSDAIQESSARQSPLHGTAGTPVQPKGSTVIDKTLSSIANLANLLPTGTVLAFQALSPSFTNRGVCYTSNKYLTGVLLCLCTVSCVFFSFTDSLVGRDGKLYYGIATTKGFFVFNFDGHDEDHDLVFKDLRRLRIRWLDYVHAFFSAVVFLTVAFSTSATQSCFVPVPSDNVKQLLTNLPLGTAFLSTMVFIVFPTTRKGIGYSDLAPNK